MDVFFIAVLIGIILVSYYYMHIDFTHLLHKTYFLLNQKLPSLASLILFISKHIAAADVIGVILFSFFSKLFFLPLPTEPYLLYAYEQGMNVFLIVLLSSLFGMLACVINYGAGKLLRTYVLNKSPFANKLTEWIESSPLLAPFIFGAALLPVPDITSLVFGASNVGIKKFMIYTLFGLLVKGYVVILAYDYVAPYLQAIF